MLSIQIDASHLCVASTAPVAGYYYAIAWVPGPNSDGIIIGHERVGSIKAVPTNSRTTFTVCLPAAHDNRKSDGSCPPAILPPKLNTPELQQTWQEAFDTLERYTPPQDTTYKDTVLRIIVYEYITSPMPNPKKRIFALDAPLQHALAVNSTHSHGSADDLQHIRSDLLTARLVGNIYIGHAKLWRFWNKRANSTVTYDLMDTKAPNKHLIYRGKLLLRMSPYAATPIHQSSIDLWARSYPKSKNSRYFQAGRACAQLNTQYVNSFIQPFPPFQKPFRLADQPTRDALMFDARHHEFVRLGGQQRSRLTPDKNDINNVHMPTVAIDGTWKIPVSYVFDSITYAPDDIFEWHERYIAAVCDSLCTSVGTTSDALATSIHTYLDQTVVPSHPSVEILAAMHIVGRLLTIVSAIVTYRSDFVVAGSDDEPYVVMACEDISRDPVTHCTASCDCEDAAGAVCALNRLILQGSKNHKPGEWYHRDAMWQKVRQIKCNGWAHRGLDAVQRILGYYTCPLILGTVTGAYPGEEAQRERQKRIYIYDLDAALEQYRQGTLDSSQRREIERYLCDSEINVQSLSDVHRYSLLVPLSNATTMLLRGINAEDAVGTQRHANDATAVATLRERCQHISKLVLPTLMLEGTAPLSPYCIRGASSYLPMGSDHTTLRQIEARSRQSAVTFRRNILPQWMQCGAFAMDHGMYKFLSGNNERFLCTTFYSRVTQGDFAEFAELSGSPHMTTVTWVHSTARWGVPIQKVFGLSHQDVCLLPICHRIPYNLRTAYDEVAKQVVGVLFPIRLASCPPTDTTVILPHTITSTTESTSSLVTETHLTMDVFRWTSYYIKPAFASEQELMKYKATVSNQSTNTMITEYKLVGLGATVREISVRNLLV